MPRSFTQLLGLFLLFPSSISSSGLTSLAVADDVKSSKNSASADESEDDGRLISVVLLQKKLPVLSEKSIAGSIEKAWKQKVAIGDDEKKDATDFVVKGGPGFIIQCQDTFCMMILASKPYLEADALKDVQELLAAANVGPTGHHIISQGEADRILSASPRERREMIEDALGLKVFQFKKAESERKLKKTRENIAQVESLRREVAPHLRFLEREFLRFLAGGNHDPARQTLIEVYSGHGSSEEHRRWREVELAAAERRAFSL